MQTIGIPADDLHLPEVDAVVVSLKSRSIAASRAVEKVARRRKMDACRGADHVLFKICSTFDSTDAGNIGPVMDALRLDSGDNIVLVTPAFPETGRTVYQGNLFVGSVPLNESPLKDHPLNPMHDFNLVRVLARQSATNIGLVDLGVVACWAPTWCGRISMDCRRMALARRSSTLYFASDLETIGAVALGHRVSVGASRHGAWSRACTGRVRPCEGECGDLDQGYACGRRCSLSGWELFAGDATADRARPNR